MTPLYIIVPKDIICFIEIIRQFVLNTEILSKDYISGENSRLGLLQLFNNAVTNNNQKR